MANVKVLIGEKDGVELDREEYILVAEDVPFDDTNTDIVATNVQIAIEELDSKVGVSASPGFSFGRSGNLPTGTWLLRPGSVPSNLTGINVGLNVPRLTKIICGSENADTYTVGVYQHDGSEIGLTLITSVSVIASRKETFTVDLALVSDRHLAVKVTAGSCKNLGVDLQLSGEA